MAKIGRGRPSPQAVDGRSAEELALAAARKDPNLTAQQIRDLVNSQIAGNVSSKTIERYLQEARQTGRLPGSRRPGPHTSAGYLRPKNFSNLADL